MRVAFDIGGTFTDVLYVDAEGRLGTAKLLSLMDRVGDDIRELVGYPSSTPPDFVHGSTVAANAVIEGTTSATVLITTRGFRDVLEMRDQRRPAINDVTWERAPSLIPRALVFDIHERTAADGSVEVEPTSSELRDVLEAINSKDAEAVAVCLMNSFVNGSNERLVGEALAGLSGVAVCLSSEEFAEIGEYERMITTAVNASLMPVVERYLSRIENALGIGSHDILVMQSNGGLVDGGTARRRPAPMIESGPAAGVLAAAKLAGELKLPGVLSFDMGGTTAKASAVHGAEPTERPKTEVGGGVSAATRFLGGGGHIVRVPGYDIVEVGAGGGSLAWVDRGGALRVGPAGAGADPGPACYGRGGVRPTVTDANLVLGYINPNGLADESLPVSREAAEKAIERDVAAPLGLSVVEAAQGIIRVANATMARALRAVTIEKGTDPRDLVMVAYGGSGPLHAAALAEGLGVGQVCIPPFPGIFSAVGLLLADFRHDAIQSVVTPLQEYSRDMLITDVGSLGKRLLADLKSEGVESRDVEMRARLDMHYVGQDESISVAVNADTSNVSDDALNRAKEGFESLHRDEFGYLRETDIHVTSLRMTATAKAAQESIADLLRRSRVEPSRAVGAKSQRQAHFATSESPRDLTVVSRGELRSGRLDGPAVIEEPDTSVLVPPGWNAVLDDFGCIRLSHELPK